MAGRRIRINLQTLLITLELVCFQSATASDELSRSSMQIPLVSRERIPITKVLAHPDQYQMREIRLTGTVTAMQTEIITNRFVCGVVHERTTLTVEDDTGQIEVIDHGACGRNRSVLKAPMVKVGEQIDLLVLITVRTNTELRGVAVETAIRFLDHAR